MAFPACRRSLVTTHAGKRRRGLPFRFPNRDKAAVPLDMALRPALPANLAAPARSATRDAPTYDGRCGPDIPLQRPERAEQAQHKGPVGFSPKAALSDGPSVMARLKSMMP